jgi:hypothetical protein
MKSVKSLGCQCFAKLTDAYPGSEIVGTAPVLRSTVGVLNAFEHIDDGRGMRRWGPDTSLNEAFKNIGFQLAGFGGQPVPPEFQEFHDLNEIPVGRLVLVGRRSDLAFWLNPGARFSVRYPLRTVVSQHWGGRNNVQPYALRSLRPYRPPWGLVSL